ncbi:MAG: hypothetical protein WDO24_24565 [Pseudomonadota bacterium]
MLTEISHGPKAWVGGQLQRDDWRLEIPADCRAELDAIAASLAPDVGPTLGDLARLSPAAFELTRCRGFAATVRDRLARFPGFVVLDRLPVERLSKAQATALYWLLAGLVGRPVAQAFCGTLLYDVHDTGKKIAPTVRGDLTNQELFWHTDYGFNRMPPHEIACWCYGRRARAASARRSASTPSITKCCGAIPSCCRACIGRSTGTGNASTRPTSP